MSICCGPHILTTVGDIIRYIPKKSVTDDTPALRAPRKRIRYTTGKIRYKWHSNTTGADQSGTPGDLLLYFFMILSNVYSFISITNFCHFHYYHYYFWSSVSLFIMILIAITVVVFINIYIIFIAIYGVFIILIVIRITIYCYVDFNLLLFY